jgi:hypothetical protein
VAEGQVLTFENPEPRRVRLEVNSSAETALFYCPADGEVQFLALVHGRDTLEFYVDGAFAVTVESDSNPVNIYTSDGDDISIEIPDAVILTKIAERRRRNPEMEQMALLMQRNMDRRIAQQHAEFERLLAARDARASKDERFAAILAEDASAKPTQDADAGNGEGNGGDASTAEPAAGGS